MVKLTRVSCEPVWDPKTRSNSYPEKVAGIYVNPFYVVAVRAALRASMARKGGAR